MFLNILTLASTFLYWNIRILYFILGEMMPRNSFISFCDYKLGAFFIISCLTYYYILNGNFKLIIDVFILANFA